MFINNLKSTVDWCEENYAVTDFIAEFWNTITFIPILVSAIYWRSLFPRLFVFDRSFHHVFWYLVTVSIGTALFHGTLLYKYQLVDELPMVLLSSKYVSLLLTFRHLIVFDNSPFIKMCIEFCIRIRYSVLYLIIISYFFNGTLQITFFHGFLKLYEIIVFYLVYQMKISISEMSHYNQNFHNYKYKIGHHIRLGLLSYSVAGLLWVLDHLFCDHIQFLQLHAFWHIISSIGIYHLNSIISYSYLLNNLLFYSR